jgi:DNA-binding CsgD family transcriptional regulator
LATALFDAGVPVATGATGPGDGSASDGSAWLLNQLRVLVEHVGATGPLLICVDDVQWADPSTVAALRILLPRAADSPIAWIVAVRSHGRPSGVMRLFSRLRECGAQTVTLDPFDDGATAQVVADVVGAEPTPELLAFAAGASGNAALVVALARGLVDDGLLHVDGGAATLVATNVPNTVKDLAAERLGDVSSLARRTALLASIVGRAVSFEHVASMLELSPATLLAPMDELTSAGVVVHDQHNITFVNELTRRAIVELVPTPARTALQRQAVGVLIDAGASPAEPAFSLAGSARAGDRSVSSTLRSAAGALAATDVTTAAELHRRAAELTATDDPSRGSVLADAAFIFNEIDRGGEGWALADGALCDGLPLEQEVEVQLSVARMSTLATGVRITAGRAATARPDAPAELRARHLSQLAANYVEAGCFDAARTMLRETDVVIAAAKDDDAALVLATVQSQLAYLDGDNATARELSDATRADARRAALPDGLVAERWRAEVLLAFDEFDAVLRDAREGFTSARRRRHPVAERAWARLHGRALLQAGSLDDAANALDQVSLGGDAGRVPNVDDIAAIAASGRVAVHFGDDRRARACAAVAERAYESGSAEVRRHAGWCLALYHHARGNAVAARDVLVALDGDPDALPLPRLLADVTDLVRLVRIASTTGDAPLGRRAVVVADELHRRNPDVVSIAATAAQARGLEAGDVTWMAKAAALFAASPRQLARASAQEDYGVALVRVGDRIDGVEQLSDALKTYVALNATWDVARVRRRLRDLGVRRRIVKAERPTTGWGGLTAAELAVVRLVAEGLTNRQVAERLYLSPHTVSMHLRHAYTKLDITSRVELTRLAFEHETAA